MSQHLISLRARFRGAGRGGAPASDRAAAVPDRQVLAERSLSGRDAVPFAAALVVLVTVAGSGLLTGALSLAHVVFGVAAAGVAATCTALTARACFPSRNLITAAEPADGTPSLERIEDARWRLSDHESRYRELLDTQPDIIIRSDAERRLTFVNKAFCRIFGKEPAVVLGAPLEPDLIAAGPVAPVAPVLPVAPVGPWAPSAPVWPRGPVGPSGPWAPA